MLYIKDGYPDVGEIVLCTVKKIYGNTTFVYLNEYEKDGVLTISEIAPGRIRNLRDHVVEEKQIVCKVLRVDTRNKRIDVSLRRVPVKVMIDKQEQLKKEEFSEKVYIDVSSKLDITKDDLFERTYEPIFENYGTVFEVLYEIMLDNKKIDMFTKLNENEKKVLVEIINDKIKPEEVIYKKIFNLFSMQDNGSKLVVEAIKDAKEKTEYKDINIFYMAAGKYEVKVIHDDMKSASMVFDKFKSVLESKAKKDILEVKFLK